jgi:hypothetical protein
MVLTADEGDADSERSWMPNIVTLSGKSAAEDGCEVDLVLGGHAIS